MKNSRTVFLNFLVCWSLLFTQISYASEAEEAGGLSSYFSFDAFSELPVVRNFYSTEDDSEIVDEDGEVTSDPTVRSRRTQRRRRMRGGTGDPVPTAPQSNPGQFTLTSAGCGFVDGLQADLPGISALSSYLDEALCSPQTVRDLASMENGGEIDAVDVCRHLQLYRQHNTCSSPVLTPQGIFSTIRELRNDDEMKALEVAAQAETIERESQELGDLMKMQTAFATDLTVMNYLYNKVKAGMANSKLFENLLGKEFFEEGNTTSLSEFTQKVFQCLPESEGLETILDPKSLCRDVPSYKPEITDEALAKLRGPEGCEESVDCYPKLLMEGQGLDELSGLIQIGVSEAIVRDSEGTGNIALIDPNIRLSNLPNSLEMISHFNNEVVENSDGTVSPAVVVNIMNGLGTSEGEERLNIARRIALSDSLDLIRTHSDKLTGDPGTPGHNRRQYFDGFMDYLIEDGLLNLESYSPEYIKQRLSEYGNLEGNSSLFARAAGEEDQTEDINHMVALVQSVASGQRMGDYVIYSQQQLNAVASLGATAAAAAVGGVSPIAGTMYRPPSQPNVWAQVNNYVTTMEEILENPHGREEAARNIITRIHSDVGGRLNILNTAARMFSHHSLEEGDSARMLDGMRETLSHFRNALGSVSRDAPLNANMIQGAGLESFANMAERSIRNCARKRSERRLKRQFCTPMASPEYGRQALENLLNNEDVEGNGAAVLNQAILYCSPILLESTARSVVDHNRSNENRLSMRGEWERYCDAQTQAILCGEECGPRLGDSVNEVQELVFGGRCDGRSGPRGGLTTETAAVRSDGGSDSTLDGPLDFDTTADEPETTLSSVEISELRGTRPPPARPSGFDNAITVRDKSFGSQGLSQIGAMADTASPSSLGSAPISSLSSDARQANIDAALMADKQRQESMGAEAFGQPFVPQTMMPSLPEGQELSETLREQEDAIDPASRALLERLEEMERRQTALQRELEDSRRSSEELQDGERDELLAELKKLKAEIPRLEDELKEREDVRRAVAEASSAEAPTEAPATRAPASLGGNFSTRGTQASRGPASVASGPGGSATVNSAALPVEPTPNQSGSGGFSGPQGTVRSSGGPEFVSATGGGGFSPVTDGLYTSQSVIQLTEAIRERTRIFPPGVVPSDAVLEAGGAVLIPLDEEGQFIMYEPELTVDGEIKTENGQVVFKTIVKVSEEEAGVTAGRLPASLEPDAETALPDDYDPRRLEELNRTLDVLDVSPEE